MTKTEQLAEKYADANYNEWVSDNWWQDENDYDDIKDAYRNGSTDMLERVCEWLKTYADDFGVPESESGKVYVDDQLIGEENYTSKEGSTVIIFKQNYVDNLKIGTHTLNVIFNAFSNLLVYLLLFKLYSNDQISHA